MTVPVSKQIYELCINNSWKLYKKWSIHYVYLSTFSVVDGSSLKYQITLSVFVSSRIRVRNTSVSNSLIINWVGPILSLEQDLLKGDLLLRRLVTSPLPSQTLFIYWRPFLVSFESRTHLWLLITSLIPGKMRSGLE